MYSSRRRMESGRPCCEPGLARRPRGLDHACEAYWYPLYVLIRRKGYEEHKALDLTQAYFARLLEKGTLSYMSPEQARGEVDRIDKRADVFSLGAILCQILTRRPPYVGESADEILSQAARADLADALDGLDACVADVELSALARHCLEPEPTTARATPARSPERWRFISRACKIASAGPNSIVSRPRPGPRRSPRGGSWPTPWPARPDAAPTAERKRRRATLALAASLLALVMMGGLGAIYYQKQRSALLKVIGEVSTRLSVAKEKPEEVGPWETAQATLNQAEKVADGEPVAPRQIATLRDEVEAGAKAAERAKILLDRVVDIRSAKADDPDGRETDFAYTGAFREAGLDFSALPSAEIGQDQGTSAGGCTGGGGCTRRLGGRALGTSQRPGQCRTSVGSRPRGRSRPLV